MSAADTGERTYPVSVAWAITPNDANDVVNPARPAEPSTIVGTTQLPTNFTRGLYVGGAGDLTVIMHDDVAAAAGVTLKAVPVGTYLPLNVRRVLATGTTATLIIAFG